VHVTRESEDLLAELGWHPQYGARPLTRVIEERVLTPIAVEIARRPQMAGVTVRVERSGREIKVTFG
jgi:ATP-dependent Clp protease ATP-binding subunit ClpA